MVSYLAFNQSFRVRIPVLLPRILWCDYDVAVASQIVILIVWVQLPLVTPKNFYATLADVVIAVV